VKGALDAGTVVVAELSDIVRDVIEIRARHGAIGQKDLSAGYASFRLAAEVENDLEEL
jgi:hypothetical protein